MSAVRLEKIYIDNFHYYKAHYNALEKSLGKTYPERFEEFLGPENYKRRAAAYERDLRHNIRRAAAKYGIRDIRMLF